MHATLLRHMCLALLLSLGMAGCSRHPEVTVTNNAGVTLMNVVISGAGFSQRLGDMNPDDSARATVRPTADSGLRVTFDANGKHHNPPEDGYLEASPHYRVTATVAPDFSVKVESNIKP